MPPTVACPSTGHRERRDTEDGDEGIALDESIYDSSVSSEDEEDEEDIGDVDMEDLLSIEGEIPLDTYTNNNATSYNSPYSSGDWLGSRRSVSPINHDTSTDVPAPLSLFEPTALTEARVARMEREERKRRIREEDQRMSSFGFKYVVAVESKGEYELCCHPYLSRYRVRQRSLLRNGWFLEKDDEGPHSGEECSRPGAVCTSD